MNAHFFVQALESLRSPDEVETRLAWFLEGLVRVLEPSPTREALEAALAHYRETGRVPFPAAPGADPALLWLLDAAFGAARALESGLTDPSGEGESA